MRNLLRVFVLTKREQRVVIVIMLAVVVATLATHYLNNRAHISVPTLTSTPAPTPSAEDDEAATSEETP